MYFYSGIYNSKFEALYKINDVFITRLYGKNKTLVLF